MPRLLPPQKSSPPFWVVVVSCENVAPGSVGWTHVHKEVENFLFNPFGKSHGVEDARNYSLIATRIAFPEWAIAIAWLISSSGKRCVTMSLKGNVP